MADHPLFARTDWLSLQPAAGGRCRNVWLALIAFVLIPSLPLAFVGCGGGEETATSGGGSKKSKRKSSDEESDGSEIKEGIEELESQLREAQAHRLLASEFKDIEEKTKAILDLIEEGEVEKAERRWRSTRRSMESLVTEAKSVADRAKELDKLRSTVEEARKLADAQSASENAPLYYKNAVEQLQKAIEEHGKRTSEGITSAKRAYDEADMLFRQAAQIAEVNKADRQLAETERAAMEELKKQALEKGAKEKALSYWSAGETAENRAKVALDQGEFKLAYSQYQMAKNQYIGAISQIKSAEEAEAALRLREEERQKWLASQGGGNSGSSGGAVLPPSLGGGETGNDPTTSAPSVAVEDVKPTTDCGFATDGTWDWDNYPNELDSEDEQFLLEHIGKLTAIGAPTYDPSTGQILLDYTIGRFVKKEANTLSTPASHVQFDDFNTQRLADEQLTPENAFTFTGAERGQIIFEIPFRYGVRMSFDMHLDLIRGGRGRFGAIVNYDPRKKNFLSTDFLGIGTDGQTKRPGPGPFARHASVWADRTKPYPWTVEYRMPDPEKAEKGPLETARFSVTYHGGETPVTNSVPLTGKSFANGWVGFYWSDCKFKIFSLKICGVLDKKAAVEQLRKKLGIPKGSGASTKPVEEEEVEEVGDI